MQSDFLAEKKYEAFTAAITRYRWFVLAMILLSCGALAHVYVEHGFTEAQKLKVIERSLLNQNSLAVQEMAKLETQIAALKPEDIGTPKNRLLIEHAVALKQQFLLGDSLLRNMSLPERKLPLLEFTVPWNDYVVVLAMLILVCVIGTWLSCRTVLGQIKSLQPLFASAPELKELIRFNFFFTSLGGTGFASKAIQTLAILMPVFAYSVSGAFDLAPGLSDFFSGRMGRIYTERVCFYFICLAIMVPFSILTLVDARAIDKAV